MLSWMHGYVSGAGLSQSTADWIWDGIVLAGTQDEAGRNDIKVARATYCRDSGKDPICSIWTITPVRAMRDGSITRDTNSNGLIAWTERYCAEHPLDKFSSATHKLLLELKTEPKPTGGR